MCLSPVNVWWWSQTELGASSVANITDRQAGRPAVSPTCQLTRSKSAAHRADTTRTVHLRAGHIRYLGTCRPRPPFAGSAISHTAEQN